MIAAMALGVVALTGVAGCGGSDGAEPAMAGAPPDARPASGQGGSGAGSGPAADKGAAQQPVSADQRTVVRSAQLSIRVDDVATAARAVAAIGPRFGGYVADEETADSHATVQLRVESARLDEALAALTGDIGEVTSRRVQATDVTEQTVDLQARITAQRASVDRVRTLLANATTVGEIVEIESQLTTRQAELDSLQQRLAALEGRADLADVTVMLHRTGSPLAQGDDDTGFLAGLRAGWRAFVDATEVGLTVLGVLLPFAVALAIPVTLVGWLIRRGRRSAARPAPISAGPPAAS